MNFKQSRKLKETEKKIIASSQEWKCKICLNLLSASYQIDHIIPFSVSNNDCLENLQALCSNCHSSKTQREYNRIYKFKKLCALKKERLCWFCLESKEDEKIHICNNVLKEIDYSETVSNSKRKMDDLDKYFFTNDSIITTKNKHKKISNEKLSDYRLRTSLSKLSLKKIYDEEDVSEKNDSLNIKINCKHIFINNIQKDSNDLSILTIAKAINEAVIELNIKNKISCIEMQILLGEEFNEDTPDELFDFIYDNLPQELKKEYFLLENLKFLFVA